MCPFCNGYVESSLKLVWFCKFVCRLWRGSKFAGLLSLAPMMDICSLITNLQAKLEGLDFEELCHFFCGLSGIYGTI